MTITIEDEDLAIAVTRGVFQGKYKRYRSNAKLKANLAKVVAMIQSAPDYEALKCYRSLACEALTADRQGTHSLRLGYGEKYRLIYRVHESEIEVLFIEISEHYGDH